MRATDYRGNSFLLTPAVIEVTYDREPNGGELWVRRAERGDIPDGWIVTRNGRTPLAVVERCDTRDWTLFSYAGEVSDRGDRLHNFVRTFTSRKEALTNV